MRKITFLTVLSTSSYLTGVVILYMSLRKVSKTDFVVLCDQELPDEVFHILTKLNIPYLTAKNDVLPATICGASLQERKRKFGDWENTFFKLKMFELVQYDKICYLDSDMIITENIDEVFACPDFSAVPDSAFYLKNTRGLNSGTLVFCPREGMVEQVMPILINMWNAGPYPFGDQDVISRLYADWYDIAERHLDLKYNAAVSRLHEYSPAVRPKVLHFANHYKPWDMKYGYVARLCFCLLNLRFQTFSALLLAYWYNILANRAIKHTGIN